MSQAERWELEEECITIEDLLSPEERKALIDGKLTKEEVSLIIKDKIKIIKANRQ